MQKSRMKQQKSRKRAAALWLAGVLAVSLAGCGGLSGDKSGLGGADSKSEDGSGDSAAMDRYVEKMIDVDTGEIMDLRELSDGRLVLLDNGARGRWISVDGGATWKSDALPGWDEFVHGKYVDGNIVGGHYIYDMKAAPDGSVAVLYRSYESIDAEEEDAADDEEESADDKAEENSTITAVPEIDAGIWLIPPQGEAKQIELPEEMPRCLCFSEDGSRLFVALMGERREEIYEIDREAGTTKLFLTPDFAPDVFCVWENYMALKDELSGVVLYQLDTGEQIEDDVITDFVKANCTVNNQEKDHVSESTYSIFPRRRRLFIWSAAREYTAM